MAVARIPGRHAGAAQGRRSVRSRLRDLSDINATVLATVLAIASLHVLGAVLFLTSNASGETAGLSRLPLDEAWSRLVYARSFSESFTLQFNSSGAEAGATSPLWVALLGFMAWLFGVSSDGLPALAKITGIVFGAAAALMVYRVTWQVTGRQAIGALAGAVAAVEPHFAFASVSGMEVTLFSALAMAASWAYLRGRHRTAGILAALTVAARPEGLLLALLIFGSTVARWMWRREGAVLKKREDVIELAYLGLPSLLLVAIGVTYNWSVNGTPLPNAYHVRHQDIGLFPVPNMWNVWLGYFHQLPFMYGLAWIVGLPVIALGGWSIIKRHRFSAVPVALFALALAYAAAVVFKRPAEEWMFADRRHMDAAIPFITIMLFCGGVSAWQLIRRWRDTRTTHTDRERRVLHGFTIALGIAAFVAPLLALPFHWNDLTWDYSWNSRNVDEVNVEMGRWLEENTPQGALVGASPSGAIGYFSGRETIDIDGFNTHEALRSTPLEYAGERNVDYLVAFRSPYVDSVPDRPVEHETVVSLNTSLQSNVMRAYGPVMPQDDILSPSDVLLQFDSTGLALIDMVDVGNLSAAFAISEAKHDYGLDGQSSSVDRNVRAAEGVRVDDDARVFNGAEELTVASLPGQPLTIVKRYDAAIGGMVRVFADGEEIGVWELPRQEYFFGESSFEIPAEFITENRTRLRFEAIPTRLAVAGNTFFYWILTPEGATPEELRLD